LGVTGGLKTPMLYTLYYKVSEDADFNEVKVKDVEVKEIIQLLPLSKHGYWVHEPTAKITSNPRYAIFNDGTTNKEDYKWIEY
jgi:hypothetical protein